MGDHQGTPDRFDGPAYEEELQLEESSADPSALGACRYVLGSFRLKDSLGVFNPRDGGSGDNAYSVFKIDGGLIYTTIGDVVQKVSA